MRKIVSVLTIIFVLWATVFCCCSQALTLTQHQNFSCCHKDTSKADTIAKSSSNHECHCQKIEGALPQDPEFKSPAFFSHLISFTGLAATQSAALSPLLSSYAPQEWSYCRFSPTPLYLQISVLRI